MSQVTNMMIDAHAFEPSNDYKYIKAKINKSGGKSVGILNTNTNKALYLSTPLMLTWGVQEFTDDQSGRKSYDMSLQFPKEEYETENTKKFLAAMVEFQDKVKADAVENSKEWLNKAKITPEVVDALFHPMLRYPKDQNTGEPDLTRAPTLKIKLDYWDDAFNCEIYDMKHKPLFPCAENNVSPMDLIPKATNVALVIRCGGLWFANGKFGCTWRLVQALVKPKESLKGRCLIKLSDEDEIKLNGQDDGETDNDDEVAVEVAEDSDEEEEEEQPSFAAKAKEPEPEPEPEPAPKPVKKRKVVRKKALASE